MDTLTNNDDEDDDTYHTQDDHHLLGPEKVIRDDLNCCTHSDGAKKILFLSHRLSDKSACLRVFTLAFFHQYLFFSFAALVSNCEAPACRASALSSSSDSFWSRSRTLSTFTRMMSTTCGGGMSHSQVAGQNVCLWGPGFNEKLYRWIYFGFQCGTEVLTSSTCAWVCCRRRLLVRLGGCWGAPPSGAPVAGADLGGVKDLWIKTLIKNAASTPMNPTCRLTLGPNVQEHFYPDLWTTSAKRLFARDQHLPILFKASKSVNANEH